MSAVTSPTSPSSGALPHRATTGLSSYAEDAVPDNDPTTTAGLLAERLQAWKHACGYLEDYMGALEKTHGKHAKEYEKVLKTISNPLREGHHFDQSLGGVAGFFENMRSNTQAMINTNLESEKTIKGSVLPILERLHKEIKHKAKELETGAQKGSKEVTKLRNVTQKHIEFLGQQTASYDSAGGKMSGHDDPYVISRGVIHRLNHQVIAENNHQNDLLAVQQNFKTFEAHVVEVFQQAMEAFNQIVAGQAQKTSALHNDMLGTIQAVPRNFEWDNFGKRCADRLANPDDAPRSAESIQFPNMDHKSTQPLIEGSLERKSRNKLSWGYSTSYYVVTPSKFLHEFKDNDNTRADPKPELSIYLPDAVIGSPSGEKFNIKGKDKSKTMSSKLTGSSELSFKAHSAADAQRWFSIIQGVAGATGPAQESSPAGSAPASPAVESSATFATTGAVVDEKADDTKIGGVDGAAEAATPAAAPAAEIKPAPTAEGHAAQEAGVTGSDEKKEVAA